MSREKDIQTLINEVLNIELVESYDHNKDVRDYLCPFCYEKFIYDTWGEKEITLDNIIHSKDCAYLIAKDLNTKEK